MSFRRRTSRLVIGTFGLFGLALALAPAGAAAPASSDPRSTPTPLWGNLLDHGPVAVDSELPQFEPTPLDGAYVRVLHEPPQWWSCLRCADYRPAGGTWRVLLDRGVLRLLYDVTGWRTLASYELDGERLRVFNDPICPWDEGTYRWAWGAGGLRLSVIEDACAFGLRAENLTAGVWFSCVPPDLRAAASDAWSKPEGCAPPRVEAPPETPPSVHVLASGGDARKVPSLLEWMASANAENRPPPSGVALRHAPEAVLYGLNVVLWRGGDWIEMTTDRSLESIGVQFWGPSRMGNARVLFDGQEVWRGNVADLGRYLQLFGGFVEVSEFGPGEHTLRVEHLGADDRPVTVLFFGGR